MLIDVSHRKGGGFWRTVRCVSSSTVVSRRMPIAVRRPMNVNYKTVMSSRESR